MHVCVCAHASIHPFVCACHVLTDVQSFDVPKCNSLLYVHTSMPLSHSPELCRGTKFTALLPVNSRRKKVVLRTYHNTFPSLSVYLNFSIHFGQVNGISLVNVSKGKECLDSHFVNDKHVSLMQ